MNPQKPYPRGGEKLGNSMKIPGQSPRPTAAPKPQGGSGPRPGPAAPRSPASPNFFEENGDIKRDLFLAQAQTWADYIRADGAKKPLTSHQLRRFYGDVKDMERKVSTEPNSFSRHWPVFSMLKAKAAYASNSKNKKIPAEFRQFIDKCVDQVNGDEKAFKAFCLFFEAVVGYCYGKGME